MNNKRKILLAPSTNHQQIIKDILLKRNAMLGTSILPFYAYLNQFKEDDKDQNTKFAQAYQIIQNVKNECSVLSNSLIYPQIVQQLVDFTMQCIHYGINYSDLPKSTLKEKDIALLVGELWPIYEGEINLHMLKTNVKDASNIEIFTFNHSLDQKLMIDYLQSVGAKTIKPHLERNPETSAFFALNHAKEAEAVAQHLLENDATSTLIVCCETSVLPTMLTSAFRRYNLDASSDISSNTPILIDQFLSLFGLITHSNIEYLYECVHNNVFSLKNPVAFLKYISLRELDYDKLFQPFDYYAIQKDWVILDNRDIKNLVNLEKDAEKDRKIIINTIQHMKSAPLQASFEFFANQFPFTDFENQQTLLSLKELIEKLSILSLDPTTFDTVFLHLSKKITSPITKHKKTIHLTSLAQSYQPGFDQVIIVGANQQHFPGFSKQNGIIDEQYLLTIPFPSLEDRLNHHLRQLNHLTVLAPTVIISYATSTFDGKTMAPAYEIIEHLQVKPKAWSIQSYGTNQEKSYELSPAISKSLFLEDNTLYGSVSSFEVFYQCQYRYFLKSGMKLSANDPQPILVALIGSISHAIVENIIKTNTKQYAQLSDSELSKHVMHYFMDLHTLHPKQKIYWDFIAERLTHQLSLALKRLDAMEQATTFNFNEAERKFVVDWDLPNNIKLYLNGYIDRIDTNPEHFRIVDYKSSEKNLSLSNVKAGLQLQLLTYLVVADNFLDKKASGAFYYSFLNKNVDVVQQKLSNGKLIHHSMEDDLESFHKAHKLSGWFVDDDGSMYDSDWFIKHVSKTGKVKKSGLFDLKKIESLLITLYTNLSNQLQEGKIDRNPVQGACDYCDFKHICIFKNSYRKLTDLDIDNTLKQGDQE